MAKSNRKGKLPLEKVVLLWTLSPSICSWGGGRISLERGVMGGGGGKGEGGNSRKVFEYLVYLFT